MRQADGLSAFADHGVSVHLPSLALVGNAAQTLHPIAGQGFNLGLRDVMSLAETLAQAWGEQKDCGAYSVLSHYQKRRQADKEATIGVTDGLVHLLPIAGRRWLRVATSG
jgi:2-polyprenyl-6-methoxyphenol hydroxylase-like FAD-dependent oxidoreductase